MTSQSIGSQFNSVTMFFSPIPQSICLVRYNPGRTTAPTPAGAARTPSRGRRPLRSSLALSSGTRPNPRKRRPRSPARRLPSSPPAPRGTLSCAYSALANHSAVQELIYVLTYQLFFFQQYFDIFTFQAVVKH